MFIGNLPDRPLVRAAVLGLGLVVCAAAFAAPASRTTSNTYYANGLLNTVDGPRTDVSDVTTYEYTAEGFRSKITNALGYVTQITAHDASGRPLTIVDPNGVTTTMTYTARGWLDTITVGSGADAAVTDYDYDVVGQVTKVTLPNGVIIEYTYDAAQRLTAITDGAGNSINYTLDAVGNITKETNKDSSGFIYRSVDRVFDELSRLREVASDAPMGQVTLSQDFDAGDRLTHTQPGLKPATENLYDALDRIKRINHPDGGVSEYTYDSADRLVSVKDQRGLVTTYTYDGLGNLIQVDSPDTGITTHDYDAAGNRIYSKDAKGVEVTYSYDALNRLTAVTYPAHPDYNVTYSYDDTSNGNKGVGRLTGITESGSSERYTYNTLGQITARTVTVATLTFDWAYEYDKAGNLTRITYPKGRVVNYQYNSLGQVTTVTTAPNATTAPTTVFDNAQYLPFGPVVQFQYGNGVTTHIDYDKGYRVEQITVGGADTVIQRRYGFEPAGNITDIDDVADTSRSQLLSYDDASRLDTADGGYGQLDFDYDLAGNRTKKTVNTSEIVEDYTYGATSNQLDQLAVTQTVDDPVGGLLGGGTSQQTSTHPFSYDANGSLTDDPRYGQTLTYTPTGRVQRIDYANGNARFYYNVLGQRIRKIVQTEGLFGGMQTDYHIYHYGLNGELLFESRSGSSPSLQREYIYINGQPRVMAAPSTNTLGGTTTALYYLHNDHLGTTQVITDADQEVVWEGQYQPFGEVAIATGQISFPLRFPGQYYDQESGYYYNYFRDYDPMLGRYIQSDPIGLQGGLNTYAYVYQNPLRYKDPLGLIVPAELVVPCNGAGCRMVNTAEPDGCRFGGCDDPVIITWTTGGAVKIKPDVTKQYSLDCLLSLGFKDVGTLAANAGGLSLAASAASEAGLRRTSTVFRVLNHPALTVAQSVFSLERLFSQCECQPK